LQLRLSDAAVLALLLTNSGNLGSLGAAIVVQVVVERDNVGGIGRRCSSAREEQRAHFEATTSDCSDKRTR
jgi:hypothetical protein